MTYLTTVPSGYPLQSLAESASRAQVAYIVQVPAYATTPPADDTHVKLLNSQYLTPQAVLLSLRLMWEVLSFQHMGGLYSSVPIAPICML
jgi:hypothetical protein